MTSAAYTWGRVWVECNCPKEQRIKFDKDRAVEGRAMEKELMVDEES